MQKDDNAKRNKQQSASAYFYDAAGVAGEFPGERVHANMRVGRLRINHAEHDGHGVEMPLEFLQHDESAAESATQGDLQNNRRDEGDIERGEDGGECSQSGADEARERRDSFGHDG